MERGIKIKKWQWTILFLILISWTALVIGGGETNEVIPLVAGSALEGNIYIESERDGFITQATRSDMVDFLFNKDFELIEKKEVIPSSKYSVRADFGSTNVEDENANSINHINFFVIDKQNKQSQGSLEMQIGRRRISLSLYDFKLLDNSLNRLEAEFSAKGNNALMEVKNEKIRIVFDKKDKTLDINGEGDIDFSIENMKVDFCDGCENKEISYFLLEDNGKLEENRGILEVRELLEENPEMLKEFMKLEVLNSPRWALLLPVGY